MPVRLRLHCRWNVQEWELDLTRVGRMCLALESFLNAVVKDITRDARKPSWFIRPGGLGPTSFLLETHYGVGHELPGRFNDAVTSILSYYPGASTTELFAMVNMATMVKFAALSSELSSQESLLLSVGNEANGHPGPCQTHDKESLASIGEMFERESSIHHGRTVGKLFQWNPQYPPKDPLFRRDDDFPYFLIRELDTGNIVKCLYFPHEYRYVAEVFAVPDCTVDVRGTCSVHLSTGQTTYGPTLSLLVHPPPPPPPAESTAEQTGDDDGDPRDGPEGKSDGEEPAQRD